MPRSAKVELSSHLPVDGELFVPVLPAAVAPADAATFSLRQPRPQPSEQRIVSVAETARSVCFSKHTKEWPAAAEEGAFWQRTRAVRIILCRVNAAAAACGVAFVAAAGAAVVVAPAVPEAVLTVSSLRSALATTASHCESTNSETKERVLRS